MHDVKSFELEKRIQALERYMSGVVALALVAFSVSIIGIYVLLSQ